MKPAVLCYSGGLDSTCLLYDLLQTYTHVYCLAFNYGQRHNKELVQAKIITSSLRSRVLLKVVDLTVVSDLLTGALQKNSGIDVPEGHYADLTMRSTIVPNRNMVFLSLAGSYALTLNVSFVFYGAHAGDHTVYPDCRPEFSEALSGALALCDHRPLVLKAPFIHKKKHEILKATRDLGVPYATTWSCYKGGEKHCGKCGTCVERKESFLMSRIPDPTVYEDSDV